MARPKAPIALLEATGKKHLTKQEKAERAASEVHASADQINPPTYLKITQKRKFLEVADQLISLKIMSNLDCDALARYIQSEERYRQYDRLVGKKMKEVTASEVSAELIGALEKLEGLRDKAFKQCRAAAGDLGLTISSRCRIVVPQSEEKPKESKWNQYQARDRSG